VIILRNSTTGKSLKLKDKDAKEVFGIEGQKHAHLICLPARNVITTLGDKNIQIVQQRRRTKKIGGTCVVRMGGIGDLIILSSSLVKMKMKNPESPLTLATLEKYVPIMKGLKGIDLCIPIDDISKYSFDRMIDLRWAVEPSNIGPGSLSWRQYVCNDRSDNFDKLCGVVSRRKYFNVPVNKLLFTDKIKGVKIGFCPVNGSIVRSMPPDYVEPTIKLLLAETGGTVVLVGKTEAWSRDLLQIKGERIRNLIDKTSEEEMIAICSRMDLIIAPDTGILHIAGALKKKAIGLFGPINPDTRIAYYKTVVALGPYEEMQCIPCHDVPGACDCGKPGGAPCMRLITPERIAMTAKAVLR
jgi:ADP-heptose:LPS heptosyltransferase